MLQRIPVGPEYIPHQFWPLVRCFGGSDGGDVPTMADGVNLSVKFILEEDTVIFILHQGPQARRNYT